MNRTERFYLVLWIITSICVQQSHVKIDKIRNSDKHIVAQSFMSFDALRLVSLGYRVFVADYYWLNAISHFGQTRMHALGYPHLEALVRRVLALDPYFAEAYKFAGTALTVQSIDPKVSQELLLQGLRYRKDVWEIPFYFGFNAFYFFHDEKTAATGFAKASLLPGAPEIAGMLATRLAAQAGDLELGLSVVESVLATTDDKQLTELYQERKKLLQLEVELKWLERGVEIYADQYAKQPKSLRDLLSVGILTQIPRDPLGGEYSLDSYGKIQTTSDAKRLRTHTMQ